MQDLKPCPFCGDKPETLVCLDKCGCDELVMSAYVKCTRCGVFRRRQYDMKGQSFEDWVSFFDFASCMWNERAKN